MCLSLAVAVHKPRVPADRLEGEDREDRRAGHHQRRLHWPEQCKTRQDSGVQDLDGVSPDDGREAAADGEHCGDDE